MTDRLALAESYLDRGLSILPLRPGDKRPVGRWKPLQQKPMDPATAALWWGGRIEVPYGIGIIGGAISGGLTVLDIEPENVAWARAAVPLPETATVQTARGGLHVYCRGSQRCGKLIFEDRVLGDVRSNGGFVAAPPTVIKSGRYVWNAADWRVSDLAPTPDWAQESRTQVPGARVGAAGSAAEKTTIPPLRAPGTWVRDWRSLLPSKALALRRLDSETDFWLVCELIHLGAGYDDVEQVFLDPLLGANARWHVTHKGSPSYLWDTYRNALAVVTAEIESAIVVRCHRVGLGTGGVSQRRATIEVFPLQSSTIYRRKIAMTLGVAPHAGALSGEWLSFLRAFGVADPIRELIKPRTLARAVLDHAERRVVRFIDRTAWGLK
jgi:hypothetical protein